MALKVVEPYPTSYQKNCFFKYLNVKLLWSSFSVKVLFDPAVLLSANILITSFFRTHASQGLSSSSTPQKKQPSLTTICFELLEWFRRWLQITLLTHCTPSWKNHPHTWICQEFLHPSVKRYQIKFTFCWIVSLRNISNGVKERVQRLVLTFRICFLIAVIVCTHVIISSLTATERLSQFVSHEFNGMFCGLLEE